MRFLISAAAAAMVLAAMAGFCDSVVIELKNGDRITGHVLSDTTNVLVLSNAWSASLAVPQEQIARRFLDTNAIAANLLTNKTTTNAVELAKVVASTNTLFSSPYLRHWHGELVVGADLTFSERNRQVYNAKSKFTYARDRFKAITEFDTTYGRSEVEETVPGTNRKETTSVTDANRMNGSVKFEYDLNKQWYIYELSGAGYDEIRKINLRYEVGPGLGYRLVQQTNLTVATELGFNYQEEQHQDGSDVNTFFFRLAEMAAWKITPRLTWDEKLEYMPRVEDFAEYRIRFESNLRYALLQNIFLNLSVVDIYDSEPAAGVSQNDLQVRSSVGVKF